MKKYFLNIDFIMKLMLYSTYFKYISYLIRKSRVLKEYPPTRYTSSPRVATPEDTRVKRSSCRKFRSQDALSFVNPQSTPVTTITYTVRVHVRSNRHTDPTRRTEVWA